MEDWVKFPVPKSITLHKSEGSMSDQLLKEAFIEGLGIAPDTEVCTLKYRSIEQWDSVGHMALVSCIEEKFDIMLESEDVIDMSSFNRAKEILGKYGFTFA